LFDQALWGCPWLPEPPSGRGEKRGSWKRASGCDVVDPCEEFFPEESSAKRDLPGGLGIKKINFQMRVPAEGWGENILWRSGSFCAAWKNESFLYPVFLLFYFK
jgi:hypothetical protein